MATKKTEPTKKEMTKMASKKPVKKEEGNSTIEKAAVETAKKAHKNGVESPLFDITGKNIGTIDLPSEIFAAKINPVLMSQAVRVYLANQRKGSASTKTRGEVTGSTRKIYRQKGTGRARHGGVRAPIFVHGGIAHGPKPTDHSRSMPRKMKRLALISALSGKVKEGQVKVVEGMSQVEMKTKPIAAMLSGMKISGTILLIMPNHMENVLRASRNIQNVRVTSSDRTNTYEVLEHKTILLMKETIKSMEGMLGKETHHGSK